MFTIECLTTSGPAQLCCIGELDMAEAPRVSKLLGEFEETDVVLDFSNVTFLDSGGIGMLIGQQQRLHAAGFRLRLDGLRGAPRRALDVSGLLDAFV